MQLFCVVDATIFKKKIFAPENVEKPPSKVAHNRPQFFFQYCQPTKNQPKSYTPGPRIMRFLGLRKSRIK